MAQFRRTQLIAAVVVILAAAPARTQSPPVTLKTHGDTGLCITNTSDKPVSLKNWVLIQQWNKHDWNTITLKLRLISACPAAPAPSPGECFTLGGRQSFEVVRWTGYSCGEQCSAPCRGNLYYGPGKFRYAVQDCKSGRTVYGPAFGLPAHPPD